MTGEPVQPGSTPTPPPEPPVTPRRLVRPRQGRVLCGVALGIADYFDADPALVRIACVAIAILTGGAGVIAYIVACFVIPEADGAVTTRAATRPRERDVWGGVVWGLLLVAIGVIALLSQFDIAAPSWRVMLSGALILVGLVIIAAARQGVHGGLIAIAIVLSIALGVTIPFHAGVDSGFGERRVTVSAPGDLESSYSHAFGSLTIDLGDAALPSGTTTLTASMAFGELTVRVPAGVAVRVTSTTAFSSTELFGENLGAFDADHVTTTPGYDQAARRLDLTVTTAFGSTKVQR